MIDEIFEMVMKEAKSRPGDDLKEKAFYITDQLIDKITAAFRVGSTSPHKPPQKDDKPA